MRKKICTGIAVVIIPIVCLYLLQCLLVPKYASDIKEGAMIKEYYNSEKNHDVLILGDCEVYENISPVTMWENYGISSYIRGSAEQLIWQSYYLLEDTLKYEKPQVVIVNVLAMTESDAKNEAYNRMTLDGMKLSKYKIASIKKKRIWPAIYSHCLDITQDGVNCHQRISDICGKHHLLRLTVILCRKV